MASVAATPVNSPFPNGKALSVHSMAPSLATTTPGPDLTEVEELLATMKQTLGTLGATFDTLGEQTAHRFPWSSNGCCPSG